MLLTRSVSASAHAGFESWRPYSWELPLCMTTMGTNCFVGSLRLFQDVCSQSTIPGFCSQLALAFFLFALAALHQG
ncbi:hypothetical protein HZ326_22684 [Fusarium oxysporum f. sp. albedinis]|nr:hypothetical protein HZ326_22684 [Fusarium oxysporum f. sp. albedinis]